MPHLAFVLVASSGCRQLLGFEELSAGDASGPQGDGPINDGANDGPSGAFCYGTSPIRPCFETEPVGTLTIVGDLNTDLGCPSTQILDGQPTCVFAGGDVELAGSPHVTGSRPVVVVGSVSLRVGSNSVLDLSSSRLTGVGAGAMPDVCSTALDGLISDGSAGGSFGTIGGDGGNGPGGIGGIPGPVQPVAFRGGCDGGFHPTRSLAGLGGGAVRLISPQITIEGVILATGGGGGGGKDGAGGAGGGSGGYIGLDAPSIAIGNQGGLIATGGGGGAGNCNQGTGPSGEDAGINILASGGNSPGAAGDGGEGGLGKFPASAGTSTTTAGCGGGGGGGGAGVIELFGTANCGQCFPTPINH